MKVLVVEDDHFWGTQFAERLGDRGTESVVVTSVEEALKVDLRGIGAAIIDGMLPNDPERSGISHEATRSGFSAGVALCRELRRLGFKGPMVLMSAGIFGVAWEAREWAGQNGVDFVLKEDGAGALMRRLEVLAIVDGPSAPKAFIVHGHDEESLLELKDYLQNTLHWQEPVVLREQQSCGKTIIEKFEDVAPRIDCVFVLLTPDDPGLRRESEDDKRRARQNVIFELGFFYTQMGRKSGRVFALRKGNVELPSDIQGVIWIDISKGIKAAGEDIRREVAHLGERTSSRVSREGSP